MPDDLYERDVLAWAEQQAALLRRLAQGEGVIEAVDWPNVIEEVQDVGLSALRSCQGSLSQGMAHLLKLHAWPASQSAARWREKAGAFLDDAERSFTPSMRPRVELDDLYAKALRRARLVTDDAGTPRPLPEACPFTLDRLLAGDVVELVATLSMPGC